MNNNTQRMMALIKWVKHKDGGRRVLPIGQYSAPALFDGCNDPWSVVLDIANQSNSQRKRKEQYARISMLVPDKAPSLLRKDATFTLYEGTKVVAHGVCLHPTQ